MRTLEAALGDQRAAARLGAWTSVAATMSLLLLTATGLYALMAFTVAQRLREIGIRVALGAIPGGLMRGILARALRQLASGVAVGVAIVAICDSETGGELTGGLGPAVLPAIAAFVLLVGIVAAAVPALRALLIQPTEALKQG